jgi:hypothetical protein
VTQSHLPVRVGVFESLLHADRAVERLLEAGFDRRHVSVICPQCSDESFGDVTRELPAGARTPARAVGGGAIGAVLGGLVTVVGLTATGGLGLLTVGPLLLAAGGGAVAGGFVGAMTSRGFERQAADFYDQALQRGQVLVAVEDRGPDAAERLARAEHILAECGAHPMALPDG